MEQVGKYKLLSRIGQGSFGAVFKAQDNSGNYYAVKKLCQSKQQSNMQMIENELNVLQSLEHPNLISFKEIIKTSSYVYIITEYCGGGDLESYINNSGPISDDLAKKWIISIVEALNYLKSRKIIHRDIKLANILLTSRNIENSQVKICDFGFSKNLGKFSLTSTKLGTPLYMAPEMFEGKNYTYKVDVWSLGIMLYEMLFGKSPFNCSNLTQLMVAQKKPLVFPAKSDVSQSAIDLIKMMCQICPDSRPDYSEILSSNYLKIKKDPENLSSEEDSDDSVDSKDSEDSIDSNKSSNSKLKSAKNLKSEKELKSKKNLIINYLNKPVEDRSQKDLRVNNSNKSPEDKTQKDLILTNPNISSERRPQKEEKKEIMNPLENKEKFKNLENFALEKEQIIVRIKLREIKLGECNEVVRPLLNDDQFYYIFNLYASSNYQMNLNSIKSLIDKYPNYDLSEIMTYHSAYTFLVNEINETLNQAWIKEFMSEEILIETLLSLTQEYYNDRKIAKAITGVGYHLYPSNQMIHDLYMVFLN